MLSLVTSPRVTESPVLRRMPELGSSLLLNVIDVSTVVALSYVCGPSCTEFVNPGCWHFVNGATSKIDDVLIEHGGLLHVLPLAIHLDFFFTDK